MIFRSRVPALTITLLAALPFPAAAQALRPSLGVAAPSGRELVTVSVRGFAAITPVGHVSRAADMRAGLRSDYDALVAAHAKANGVPEHLVHRIIVRESKYQPTLVGRGGTLGMMQIKLATARGMGYGGTADGLLDPETNLTWGVRYLAGAWRAAHGDADLAVRKYAAGYYEKRVRTSASR